MAARLAWRPGYEGDEVALGIALAFALHAIPVVALVLRVYFPAPQVDEKPFVSQPVIGANLLKLGKPIDPKKLPDRLVPRARTAPPQKIVASREDPAHKNERPDAGPPPQPDAKDSAIQRLIAKSDPFAEDAGKQRPEQGFLNGSDAGTETDPSKVHAGRRLRRPMLHEVLPGSLADPDGDLRGGRAEALRVSSGRGRPADANLVREAGAGQAEQQRSL